MLLWCVRVLIMIFLSPLLADLLHMHDSTGFSIWMIHRSCLLSSWQRPNTHYTSAFKCVMGVHKVIGPTGNPLFHLNEFSITNCHEWHHYLPCPSDLGLSFLPPPAGYQMLSQDMSKCSKYIYLISLSKMSLLSYSQGLVLVMTSYFFFLVSPEEPISHPSSVPTPFNSDHTVQATGLVYI